jgi:glutaredoxin-like YruB-family protein
MAVAADTVMIYTTSTCPWCTRAKDFLRQKGVPFQEKNLEFDQAAAEEVVRRSGQMGVPVIIAGDEVIVGFDRARLERLASRFASSTSGGTASASPRPRIGLRIKDGPGGAEIGAVHPGTPGDRAGLQPGDVVVEINGRPVRSAADLEAALAGLTQGQAVALEVRRGGRPARLRMQI